MIRAASTTIVEFPELGLGPITMKRYLVEDLFGTFSIAWYGVIICVAMILACTIILRNAIKKEGMNGDSFLDYFIVAIPTGVVGARVMYVLANLDLYHSFYDAIAIWKGGIAIYGAVIAGAVAVFILAKIKKQNPLQIYDAMAPGLLLAQAIGRWGNFVNGEAHGVAMKSSMPWGMTIGGAGPFHPTFLYESLITFSGFLIATFLLYRHKKFHGELFCFYLIWYGVGRTLVEGLRTDSLMIGSLRLAQCIGVASALGGAVLLVLIFLLRKGEDKVVPEEGKSESETEITEEKMDVTASEGALPEEDGAGEKTEEEAKKEKETKDGTDH